MPEISKGTGQERNTWRRWKRWRRELPFLAAVALVLTLDQATKALIRSHLLPGESLPDQGPLRLTHVLNTGISFGLLQGRNLALALTGAIGVAALLLYYRYLSSGQPLLRVALGLQMGGAVGNLVDRVRLGYVTDFLDVGAWPVFNLADSSIVVGVTLVVSILLLQQRGYRQTPPTPPSP